MLTTTTDADGLHLFGGMQLAVDTTLVSPLLFFFFCAVKRERTISAESHQTKTGNNKQSHVITRGPRKPAQPPLRARQGGHHQKFLLQDSIDSTHSLRLGENVDVIEECEIPLIIPAWPREQDAVPQINGSPSFPPSPWLIVCTVPESSSHRLSRGSPVEEVHKRQHGGTTIHSNPAIIARLEMRSNALTPSTEVNVNCRICLTQSLDAMGHALAPRFRRQCKLEW